MDITTDNFDATFQEVCIALDEACFVAIDTEFTGLNCWPSQRLNRSTLSDNINERYFRLSHTAKDNRILQVGLCIFRYNLDNNDFTAMPYNFNVFPETINELVGKSLNLPDVFSCQTGSIHFLAQNGFDFNKCYTRGIPYVNGTQEGEIRKALEGEYLQEEFLEEIRSFAQSDAQQASFWLPVDRSAFLVRPFLAEKFPNLIIEAPSTQMIVIKRSEYMYSENRVNVDPILSRVVGFRRVFKELINRKIPIVGHNCLTDVVMLFQAFHHQLPENIDTFLNQTHKDLFPLLWDTKYIIKTLRSRMQDVFKGTPTSLSSLYDHLIQLHRTSKCVLPSISIPDRFARYLREGSLDGCAQGDAGLPLLIESHAAHEAGYDAWMTGVCLIRMANYMGTSKLYKTDTKSFDAYRSLLSSFDNCVNMIGGPTALINFSMQTVNNLSVIPTFEYHVTGINKHLSLLRSMLRNVDMCEVDPLVDIVRVRGEYGQTSVEKILSNDIIARKGILFKQFQPGQNVSHCYFSKLRSNTGIMIGGSFLALCMGVGIGLTISSRQG